MSFLGKTILNIFSYQIGATISEEVFLKEWKYKVGPKNRVWLHQEVRGEAF